MVKLYYGIWNPIDPTYVTSPTDHPLFQSKHLTVVNIISRNICLTSRNYEYSFTLTNLFFSISFRSARDGTIKIWDTNYSRSGSDFDPQPIQTYKSNCEHFCGISVADKNCIDGCNGSLIASADCNSTVNQVVNIFPFNK